MNRINSQKLREFCSQTFRTAPGTRIRSVEQAVAYAEERGFLFFWPISGITLPNLWTAVAGDRPVADAHDDPGHVTWGWKDSLLGERKWYYAKVLRKKSTIISLDVVPYFYALSENYGSYEDDYLTLYEQGRMSQEARLIYEALLNEGTLDTVELRQTTHLTSRESDSRFNRALTELQTDFKILPVGTTRSGGWNYAFAYDIVARHFPDLPDRAHPIGLKEARQKLIEVYFRSVGAAQLRDITKLFGWSASQAERSVDALVAEGLLHKGVERDDQPGEWITLSKLVS